MSRWVGGWVVRFVDRYVDRELVEYVGACSGS